LTLRLSTALALLVLLVPFVPPAGVAVANHGARTLDLSPETSKAALRVRVRMRATLEIDNKRSPVTAPVIIKFEVDGPGDPTDDGKTFDTPDRQCTVKIGNDGCRKSYANPTSNTGDDTIWAWIEDTPPDETEGQSIGPSPGSQPEPDGTDAVTATWFEGLPGSATLDCNPEVSTTTVRSAKTFTCNLRNPGGQLAGWEIDAENLSPKVNDPDDSATGGKGEDGADYGGNAPETPCVTDGSGQCRMTIRSETPAQAGQARICFWVDEEGDNSFHPKVDVEWDGALCDTETVTAPEKNNRTDKVALSWKHRRTVSLRSSKSRIRRGQKFRLSGAIKRTSGASSTCLASQRVLIRRNVLRDGNPNYVAFRSLKTNGDGRYRTKLRGKRSADFKASAVPTRSCFGASSRTVRVK